MKKILYTLGFLVAGIFCADAQEVTTYIGKGTAGLSATGADMDKASLNGPYGLAIDPRNGIIYITEEDSHMVSMIYNDKYYLRAGSYAQGGFVDGAGAGSTRITNPRGIAVAADGTVYIVDGGNNSIRKLSPFVSIGSAQTLTTIAGGEVVGGVGRAGYKEGIGTKAWFNDPRGIAIDPVSGDLIVADYGNQVLRRVDPATGQTSLFAGRPESIPTDDNGNGDLTGTAGAKFAGPTDIYIDANGDIYVTQDTYTIRKISNGKVTTVADLNANNINKGFTTARGLVKAGGTWFFSVGCAVEKFNGTATTIFAGAGDDQCGFQEGNGSAAMFFEARGLAMLDANNILVADQFNNRIRKIELAPTGTKEIATAQSAGFKIYPNPAENFVMIENKSAKSEATTLAVFDIAGKEIIRQNISASGAAHRLSLDAFKKGIYIMKLQSGSTISTTKLVVNK